MFKFLKRPAETIQDQRIEQISDILFPKLEVQMDSEGNEYHVDSSVDTNIDSIITDIEDGYVDSNTLNTLRNIYDKLSKIRRILDADQELDENIRYIMLDSRRNNSIENIK